MASEIRKFGRKLTPSQVCKVRMWLQKGLSAREIGERLGVSHVTVWRIQRGERYAHVGCSA